MSKPPAAARARPGRPSTGARERLLDAGRETLLAEGYAGMTTAKVALRAGENKALIAYHFGSKQGLVAAVGRQIAQEITEEVLGGLGNPTTPEEVVRGLIDRTWRILDRDARLARAYFDLNAVSVVEDEVRAITREMKEGWRKVLRGLLANAGVPSKNTRAAAVLVLAGVEGLALERIERGEGRDLGRAREMFVRGVADALAP